MYDPHKITTIFIQVFVLEYFGTEGGRVEPAIRSRDVVHLKLFGLFVVDFAHADTPLYRFPATLDNCLIYHSLYVKPVLWDIPVL